MEMGRSHNGFYNRPAWTLRGQNFNRYHSGMFRHVWWADVVHGHQPRFLFNELAALAGRLTGKRCFASDLGAGGWGLNGRFPTQRLFHSHLHISQYSAALDEAVPNDRKSVIYGGIDLEMFQPDQQVPKEHLIVFVGRLMPHKGIDALIQALPEGMTLELIGRPYNEDYTARLKALAVGKPVHFRTDCSDADIVNAYRRARCVVLPSVYTDLYGNTTRVPELLGQTPLEGMACGTPAVVTNVASLPEIVDDGVTGFLVPAGDLLAMRQVFERFRDQPELVSTMGQAARLAMEQRFSWEAVVDRCLKAYGNSPS